MIETYRRGIDSSANGLNSRANRADRGDLTADTRLYVEGIRSDEDTFQSLYVLDLEAASRVAQAENWDPIDLFNGFATMKLEHEAIDLDLQHGFDTLDEQLKNLESIASSLANCTEPVNATYAALQARLCTRHSFQSKDASCDDCYRV
ncbi:hypothetical protein MW887_003222 [Aspergillus wentii]|nr:hypothetical protein MW887_003222 [Aspergillus wentii]